VASNLANSPEGEREAIDEFWNTEIRKCDYVKARRVTMKEEF
jgi:hypothetical protein